MAQNAETIFNEFRRLGDGGDSRTAEERLKDYCRDVLTAVEGFHFDYKCKQDHQNPQLDESDKRNLAKALSGFANSGGGVLLWGIKEGPPLELRPIHHIQPFLKREYCLNSSCGAQNYRCLLSTVRRYNAQLIASGTSMCSPVASLTMRSFSVSSRRNCSFGFSSSIP